MKPLFDRLIPGLGLAALAALWCVVVVVLAGPALIDGLEPLAGRPLLYETSVRAIVVAALALFMLVWAAHLLGRATLPRLCAFIGVLLAAGSVVFVVVFHLEETLGAEFSWLRYTTAFFLVGASLVAAVVARSYARREAVRTHVGLWIALAIAFLGLAGDEIFMFHEAFGDFIRARGASAFATDLTTITYGVAALALVAFLVANRVYMQEYVGRHPAFVAMFVSATVVFLVAQMGDTFDVWTHARLLELGVARSGDPVSLFSDFWFPIWGPRQLLNDVEEVLENVASGLFCASFVLLWIERRTPALQDRSFFARPKASRVSMAILVIGFSATAWWLASARSIDSPALGQPATALAGPQQGLFHSDVVFYHPRWGVLVANEGAGDVVRYRDGRVDSLPDPHGLVSDTDCVTATDDAIYVSCPSLHTVFEYTEDGGWHPFATDKDGLHEPEALVVVDTTMYVVDESQHSIYAIDMATRRVREMVLDDYRWYRPEGIAYHPQLHRLLITDDVVGSVATVDFDGKATMFADHDKVTSPEDICVTSDGRIFISDTGRREIIELTPQGQVANRIRFHLMYGYLVGVAVAEGGGDHGEDRLYAVSSDGYMSISFAPSVLWELPLPARR